MNQYGGRLWLYSVSFRWLTLGHKRAMRVPKSPIRLCLLDGRDGRHHSYFSFYFYITSFSFFTPSIMRLQRRGQDFVLPNIKYGLNFVSGFSLIINYVKY